MKLIWLHIEGFESPAAFNPEHIVNVRPNGNGSNVLTVPGIDYRVTESRDWIEALIVQNSEVST